MKRFDFPFAARGLAGLWLSAGLLLSGSAVAELPRTVTGQPDFSGIWQTLSGADHGLEAHGTRHDAPPGPGVADGPLPYQEWAVQQRERNFAQRAALDPAGQCFSLGTPRGVYYPEPFQIFQRERDLTL
ncbi:MAG TPA: hypothetical protein VNR18_01215, partial [Hyphomicrobiales bacterium]|nr:hypothetical protein [Hyphomicrobiales bacterium]